MANPNDIVAEINTFLKAGQARSQGELTDLATTYAAFCRQANVRLRQCADCLRRGLRTEAIAHAEVDPDLLDLVAALDLPSLTDWNTVCASNDLEMAPELPLEVAEELNKAYVAQEPVKELLRQVRLMALGRAPIRDRLAALRVLAQKDPTTPQVEEDIREFEAARLQEIDPEVGRAFEAEDIGRLQTLVRELSDQRWRRPEASVLLSRITRQARDLQIKKGLGVLESLLNELHAAHAAFAYEECRSLLNKWDRIVQDNQLTVPADLSEQVRPVQTYVEQVEEEAQTEQMFRDACSALSNSLLDDAPNASDLRKLYGDARSFDLPLPEDLERQYRIKVDELDLTRRRRSRVLFSGAAVLVLLLAGGVGLVIYHSIRAGEAGRWETQIATLLEQEKLDEAGELFTQLTGSDPELAARPELQKLRAELGRKLNERAARTAEFARLIATVKAILESNPSREALKGAGETLERAGAFVTGSAEKMERYKWETEISKRLNRIEKAVNDAFLAKLDEFGKQFEVVDPTLADKDLPQFEQQLTRLSTELARLEMYHVQQDVADELRGNLLPYRTRLKSWQKMVYDTKGIREKERVDREQREQKRLEEQRALAGLAQKAYSGTVLAKALKDFASKHPDSPKAVPFSQAAELVSDWLAIQEWDELVRTWRDRTIPQKPSEIPQRLAQIKTYAAKHPTSPMLEPATSLTTYLEKADSSLQSDSTWQENLTKVMRSAVMHLVWFKTKDGRRYYMTQGQELRDTSVGLTATLMLTPDTSKVTQKLFRPGTLDKDEKARPSPQSILAKSILEKLMDVGMDNWDIFGMEVSQAILDNAEMDPILKVILLELILSDVGRHCWGAEEGVLGVRERLARLQVTEMSWMDPDNAQANMSRPQVTGVLKKLEPFSKLRDQVLAKRRGLLASLDVGGRNRGVAVQGEAGWEVLAPPGAMPIECTLWVVVQAPQSDRKVLRKIGTVRDGKTTIEPATMAGVPEGSMVFIRVQARTP